MLSGYMQLDAATLDQVSLWAVKGRLRPGDAVFLSTPRLVIPVTPMTAHVLHCPPPPPNTAERVCCLLVLNLYTAVDMSARGSVVVCLVFVCLVFACKYVLGHSRVSQPLNLWLCLLWHLWLSHFDLCLPDLQQTLP
jgi:hypothetical protein